MGDREDEADAAPVVRTRGPPLPEPVFERLVNPLVRWLLRSPFHGLVSDDVLLLTVTGRRTGREYAVPVGYEAHDGALYVTSHTDHVWWTNLRGGATVGVHLRGERRSGTAEVVEDDETVAAYVEGYIDRHGLDAVRRLAVVIEADERPDTEALVAGLAEAVVVRVELDGDAP